MTPIEKIRRLGDLKKTVAKTRDHIAQLEQTFEEKLDNEFLATSDNVAQAAVDVARELKIQRQRLADGLNEVNEIRNSLR